MNHLSQFEPIKTETGNTLVELVGTFNGHIDPNLSLAHISIPAGSSDPKHFHKKLTEVYYVLQGNGKLEMEGKVAEVKTGHCVYIPPLTEHRLINDSEQPLIILAICGPAWKPDDEFVK